jgi:hypothetical protein
MEATNSSVGTKAYSNILRSSMVAQTARTVITRKWLNPRNEKPSYQPRFVMKDVESKQRQQGHASKKEQNIGPFWANSEMEDDNAGERKPEICLYHGLPVEWRTQPEHSSNQYPEQGQDDACRALPRSCHHSPPSLLSGALDRLAAQRRFISPARIAAQGKMCCGWRIPASCPKEESMRMLRKCPSGWSRDSSKYRIRSIVGLWEIQ